MKIIVIKKLEIELTDNEIKDCKNYYKKNPELHYNLADKEEFLKCVESNYFDEYTSIQVEEKSYNEFLEKWNKM